MFFSKNMFNIRQKATTPLVKGTMVRPHRNRQTGRHPDMCREEEMWEGAEHAEVPTEVWGQAKNWTVQIWGQQAEGGRVEGGRPQVLQKVPFSAPTSARQERKLGDSFSFFNAVNTALRVGHAALVFI